MRTRYELQLEIEQLRTINAELLAARSQIATKDVELERLRAIIAELLAAFKEFLEHADGYCVSADSEEPFERARAAIAKVEAAHDPR